MGLKADKSLSLIIKNIRETKNRIMKMGGFAAARNAMMGIQEEYKKAAECDECDYT
jgi:hypothetical protein